MFTSNSSSHKIHLYDKNGKYVRSPFVSNIKTELKYPKGLAMGNGRNLYICNSSYNQILKYDQVAHKISIFTRHESKQGGLDAPFDLEFGPDGDLYVSSYGDSTIKCFDGNTGIYKKTIVSDKNGLGGVGGFTFGMDRFIYAVAMYRGRINVYNGITGAYLKSINMGADCINCRYIVHAPPLVDTDDPNGFFYVSCDNNIVKKINGSNHSVKNIIDYSGDLLIGGETMDDDDVPCQLWGSLGLLHAQYADDTGSHRNLLVVDRNHNMVKRFWAANQSSFPQCSPHSNSSHHEIPVLISVDLKTPGLSRLENRPCDIASVSALDFISVPSQGVVKIHNSRDLNYHYVAIGHRLSMPFGLTTGPKLSTRFSMRPVGIQRWAFYQTLPMEGRRMVIRLFDEEIGSIKKDRDYWIQKIDKRWGDENGMSKKIKTLIKTMPEDIFFQLKEKILNYSVLHSTKNKNILKK